MDHYQFPSFPASQLPRICVLSTQPDPAAWILSIHLLIMMSKLNLSTINTFNKKYLYNFKLL